MAEDWHLVMYNARKAKGLVGILYFIVLILIGRFLLLDTFLSVLLKEFDIMRRDRERVQAEQAAVLAERDAAGWAAAAALDASDAAAAGLEVADYAVYKAASTTSEVVP